MLRVQLYLCSFDELFEQLSISSVNVSGDRSFVCKLCFLDVEELVNLEGKDNWGMQNFSLLTSS